MVRIHVGQPILRPIIFKGGCTAAQGLPPLPILPNRPPARLAIALEKAGWTPPKLPLRGTLVPTLSL